MLGKVQKRLGKWTSLTVSDLTSLNIESAKMAYLSASNTSTMRDIRLLDESITLANAFQLSGYSSVVGSLWGVMDPCTAEVARSVYEWILKDGILDIRLSAEGLHKAVHSLRDRTRTRHSNDDPLIWATYIHNGV